MEARTTYDVVARPMMTSGRSNHQWFPRTRLTALTIPLLVFCLLLPIWWLTVGWYKAQLIAEERALAAGDLVSYAQGVTLRLNKHFGLLEALRAFAAIDVGEEVAAEREADVFFEKLVGSFEGVRGLAVAPGGVTRWTYPKHGSDFELGRDVVHDERQGVAADVASAIRLYQIQMSDSRDLQRDGLRWVAWLPVYRGYAFWGMVAVAMDMSPILDNPASSLHPVGLQIAIRDSFGTPVHGSPRLFDDEPVTSRLELPDGYWELAAVPAGGWNASVNRALREFQSGGLLALALLSTLVYLMVSRPSLLPLVVREQLGGVPRIDQEASTDDQAMFAMVSSLNGMAYRGRIQRDRMMDFVSEGCFELTGYSAAMMLTNGQLRYARLIHPDDEERVWKEIESAVAGHRVYHCCYRISTADGLVKWVLERGRGVESDKGWPGGLEGFITGLTVGPPASHHTAPELHAPVPAPRAKTVLTEREQEVLRLLAKGLSNQQIADTLVLSERTARNHVSSILLKLNLSSRTQAAVYAVQEGLSQQQS